MQSNEFLECLQKRGLKRVEPDEALSKKELEEADSDLRLAEKSLESGAAGWAVVQCYYACFHAVKALVFSKGFAEKSHRCLAIAFRDLFEREKLVEEGSTNFLDELRELREEFNYALKQIGEEETSQIIGESKKFVGRAKKRFLVKK